jgi:rRNA maturation endonuclease Nob1
MNEINEAIIFFKSAAMNGIEFTRSHMLQAVNALEKQNPKNLLLNKKIIGLGKCPMCKTELCVDDKDLRFCPTCGQALKQEGK